MRRLVVLAALFAAPLAMAAPAHAASPPNTGCAVGWDLFDASGIPFILALADNVNGDGYVCIRNLPNGKGAVVHDNTSAATDGFGG
jgi:hypothetical protein